MAYDVKVSLSKGGSGAIDGVIVAVVAAAAIKLVKSVLGADMDANTENAIAVGVGAVVSAAIVAAKRFIENWMKHRNKAAAPAAPGAPDAPQPPAA